MQIALPARPLGSPKNWIVPTCLAIAFYVALRLTVASAMGGFGACFLASGCEKVLSSPLSSIGGVPLSAIGMVATAILLGLWGTEASQSGWGRTLFRSTLAIGGLSALFLQGYALLAVRAVCTMCLLFCGMFVVAGIVTLRDRATSPAGSGSGSRVLSLIVGATIACLHLVAFPITVIPSGVGTLEPLKRLGAPALMGQRKIRVGASPADTLIVFIDPQCGHCQNEMPGLLAARKTSAGNRAIDIRWCARTEFAKRIAAIALAASEREPGEEVLRRVFAEPIETEEALDEFARWADLTKQELAATVADGSPWMRAISEDLRLARLIRLHGTPGYVAMTRSGEFSAIPSVQATAWLAGGGH